MTNDQRGFFSALLLLLGIILLVPIVFVSWLAFSVSGARPTLKDFDDLKGRTNAEAISKLTELGFECADARREPTETEFSVSICQFDQATIVGPCHWSLKLQGNITGKLADVAILGQCGGEARP